MTDPCEPPIAGGHHHPARIIGRIKRHGTARLAHRMHVTRNGCLPGSKTLLGSVVLKAAAPAAAMALQADAQIGGTDGPGGEAVVGDPGTLAPGSHTGHHTGSGHHGGTPVPEPSSLGMLVLALFAWTGMRRWFRPG